METAMHTFEKSHQAHSKLPRRKGRGVRFVAALTTLALLLSTAQLPLFGLRGVAQAAPSTPKRVALFVFPKNRNAAGDAQVLQAFMRSELLRLIGVTPVAASGEPPVPVRSLVLPSVEKGFQLLNDRNSAQAEGVFEKALKDISQYKGPLERRLLARVLKGLGSAQVMNGDITTGQENLDACLNLWPSQQLSDYGWTLDLRTAFNELVNKRTEMEPGSVEVDTEPAGAVVRVGGVLKGFSPVTVSDLAPGRHWIETSLDGYRWQGMFVDVPAGDSAIHSVELDPVPNQGVFAAAYKALEKGLPRGQVGQAMGELASAASADVVLALELSSTNSGYVLSGFLRERGEPQKISKTINADGDLPGALRAFLSGVLKVEAAADDSDLPLDGPPMASVMGDDDIVIDPRDPIFSTGDKKSESSVTSEWWFWTLVGGLAAGLVAGGVVLFGASEEGSGPAGNVVINVNRLP
jgi:hypothetical protein